MDPNMYMHFHTTNMHGEATLGHCMYIKCLTGTNRTPNTNT